MKNTLFDTIMRQIDLSTTKITHSSEYLSDNPKVKIVPDDLAELIGVSQTMMLCQIDFWVQNHQDDDHYKDGRYWTYETYDDWKAQFPYWGKTKIREILRKLKEKNLIITGNYNKMSGDNTKWYTVNYDLLDKIMSEKKRIDDTNLSESDTCPLSEYDTCHLSENGRPIPKNSTPKKSKPKTSNKWSNFGENRSLLFEIIPRLGQVFHNDTDIVILVYNAMNYFSDCYFATTGKEHPYISDPDKFYESTTNLWTVLYEVELDGIKEIIDKYFSIDFTSLKYPYHFNHFCSVGVLRNRMLELGYEQGVVDGILPPD